MKKLPQALLCLLLCCSIYAYNPSSGGELFYLLGTPSLISDGVSAAGGALTDVTAANSAVNPALTADEERFTLDAGYTALMVHVSVPPFILEQFIPQNTVSFPAACKDFFRFRTDWI